MKSVWSAFCRVNEAPRLRKYVIAVSATMSISTARTRIAITWRGNVLFAAPSSTHAWKSDTTPSTPCGHCDPRSHAVRSQSNLSIIVRPLPGETKSGRLAVEPRGARGTPMGV